MTRLPIACALAGTILALACTAGTHLAPPDDALLRGAMRANALGVTRLDGGSPSANRALDRSSCGNLAAVMQHAKLDAGMACP